MKAISTPAVITSISSRQDGSLRFGTETPEYTPEEKVAFLELQGKNVRMTITPTDETPEEEITVESEVGSKTPGQRLRAVLFILYKQSGTTDDFETFYRSKMEKIIDQLKEKIDQ